MAPGSLQGAHPRLRVLAAVTNPQSCRKDPKYNRPLLALKPKGEGGSAGDLGEGVGARNPPGLLSGLSGFVVVFEETASGLHKDSSFCFTCLFNTLARGSPYPATR